MAAAENENIADNFRILTKLDFIFARAMLSKSYNGTEPIFNEKGHINIKKGRHPLLDKKSVVPIDIWLVWRIIMAAMPVSKTHAEMLRCRLS